METTKNTTIVNEKPILIQRSFELPVTEVWKAWTEPESFKKWWGPKEYTCPECRIDFKEGGKLFACMKDKKDGKMTWSTGIYREIIPYKKIVVTDSFSDRDGNIISAAQAGMPGNFPEESLITVEFEEHYGKTNLTLKHEGLPAELHDDCRTGWNSSLDKIEKMQIIP